MSTDKNEKREAAAFLAEREARAQKARKTYQQKQEAARQGKTTQ